MCWRALIVPRPTCAPAARRAAARRNLTAPRARRSDPGAPPPVLPARPPPGDLRPAPPAPPPPPPALAHFPRPSLPPLGQQSLRKIYALREFRHLAAQVVQGRHQLLMPRVRSGHLPLRLQLGGVHFGEGPHDHQGEKPPDGDDGDQDRQGLGVHQLLGGASRSASRCLASRRSVKSIRSPNSATSRRICCSSCTTSSRRACISSFVPVSDLGRRRSARARTTAYSSTNHPTMVTKRRTP